MFQGPRVSPGIPQLDRVPPSFLFPPWLLAHGQVPLCPTSGQEDERVMTPAQAWGRRVGVKHCQAAQRWM